MVIAHYGNQPNNHPLCHSCGATVLLLLQHKLVSCSYSKLTILRASPAKFTSICHTFQSPESPKHTFSHIKDHYNQMVCHIISEECYRLSLGHNISLRAYQPCSVRNDSSSLIPRLTTPPQTEIFISKYDSHYLSISI
jgi:hypothetical protein